MRSTFVNPREKAWGNEGLGGVSKAGDQGEAGWIEKKDDSASTED